MIRTAVGSADPAPEGSRDRRRGEARWHDRATLGRSVSGSGSQRRSWGWSWNSARFPG